MRKAILVLAMLAVAGILFAEGSITSTTAYDADAVELVETIDTSVAFGPLTVANKLVLTMLTGTVWDWEGGVVYAIGPATVELTTGYGTDEVLPVTFDIGWVVGDSFSVSGSYAVDDLAAEEIGTFTIEGVLTF